MVHLKIALKVSLRLESCLVPGRFWKIFYGATGHGKNLKIRGAAFLFTLSLPLCLWVWSFSWSLRRDYRQKSQEASKLSVNSRGERTEKKTWFWLAASNQNATIITNQILRLSSVRVHQTNNDCAQANLSLCSPFSVLGSSSFSLACNHFWLALTLCHWISSSKMATEQHKDMSALQATALLGWLFTSIYEKRAQKRSIRLLGRDRLFSNSLKSRYKVRFSLFPWNEKYE